MTFNEIQGERVAILHQETSTKMPNSKRSNYLGNVLQGKAVANHNQGAEPFTSSVFVLHAQFYGHHKKYKGTSA